MRIDEVQCDACGKRVIDVDYVFSGRWYRVSRKRGIVEGYGFSDRDEITFDFCSAFCAAQWFSERVKENE